jgi:hypothetical protein
LLLSLSLSDYVTPAQQEAKEALRKERDRERELREKEKELQREKEREREREKELQREREKEREREREKELQREREKEREKSLREREKDLEEEEKRKAQTLCSFRLYFPIFLADLLHSRGRKHRDAKRRRKKGGHRCPGRITPKKR